SLGEKENILLFSDENGIFGDFKNSVNRIPVTNETKNMLQIILYPPTIEKSSAVKLISSLKKMSEQKHAGTQTVHRLT
ncbi:hypothetical protein MMJ09_26390, partial [Bacillus vallismortis]|nr:hypothetical protein [Bacillus vallismortis]